MSESGRCHLETRASRRAEASGQRNQEELLAMWDQAMAHVAAERAAWRATTGATTAARHALRDGRDGGVDWPTRSSQSSLSASKTVTWSRHFGGCYLFVDGPAFQRLCEEYHECHDLARRSETPPATWAGSLCSRGEHTGRTRALYCRHVTVASRARARRHATRPAPRPTRA
jgi:hypothetical protein